MKSSRLVCNYRVHHDSEMAIRAAFTGWRNYVAYVTASVAVAHCVSRTLQASNRRIYHGDFAADPSTILFRAGSEQRLVFRTLGAQRAERGEHILM